jgi:uncharacterized protein (TIGR02996 family)
MSDHAAFLSTICEHPDEDAPRLVYADWLEEQGDPRGEHIRLQCQRLQIQDRSRKAELAKREQEIEATLEGAWRRQLPELDHVTWREFDRGFVRSIEVRGAETFLKHADVIFAAAPIRRVHFRELRTEGAVLLAGSKHLARIHDLELHGNQIGDEGTAALADSPHAVNLKRLFLSSNQITSNGAQALAKSRNLPELVLLMLTTNQIDDRGASALADSQRLKKLQEVFIQANNLSEMGINALHQRFGSRLYV